MQCYMFEIDGKCHKIPVTLYLGDNAVETVLAIHGFGGSKDSNAINMLAQRLCEKQYNVMAIDLPAHGKSKADCSELTPEQCLCDIRSAEDYINERFGHGISLFGTSFGGFCVLNRLAQEERDYRRVVLRVPAVDMADAFSRCVMQFSTGGMEEFRSKGNVTMRISREFVLPYSLYEELLDYTALRSCPSWNKGNVLAIWAENDELAAPAKTQRFLSLNSGVKSHCVKNASHRMLDVPSHLEEAMDVAAEFYGYCAK